MSSMIPSETSVTLPSGKNERSLLDQDLPGECRHSRSQHRCIPEFLPYAVEGPDRTQSLSPPCLRSPEMLPVRNAAACLIRYLTHPEGRLWATSHGRSAVRAPQSEPN